MKDFQPLSNEKNLTVAYKQGDSLGCIDFDQYKDIKKYENKKIKCMSTQDIYQFEQSYQYVILCCQDDYYNLLMNYRIQRDMFNTHVYALCGEQNYIELYSDNIDIFQKKEDIERIIKKLYDQKKNKC